jgi:multiple sugar transport system permease protein
MMQKTMEARPTTRITETVKKQLNRYSGYVFIMPYFIFFTMLIILPTVINFLLSFTFYNVVEAPRFNGITNYVNLFTVDPLFLRTVLPNTLKYALIIGPGGYVLAFLLAWILVQLPHRVRTVLAVIIYVPSMLGGVMMTVLWRVLFSGDSTGYLNGLLLDIGLIDQPIQWLQDPTLLMNVMLLVVMWSSMGLSFLALLSGILNVDRTIYEAAYIDGLKNRFQEIFYITIPSMKPQMLFSAVMAIIGAFKSAGMAAALSGSSPPPQYGGWLIVDHMNDYAFQRFEMGYASAMAVVLLIIIYYFNRVSYKLFKEE